MLGRRRRANKTLFVAGGLEDLVPEDHLLRRVDAAVEFSWVREMVAETYSPSMGRPSIDPEAAVRLMLGGYLLGIVHDRALMRLARVNVALRWFAGFALDERLPHHSSLTRLRQRWGVERFRRMFVRVVGLCQEAGLLGGGGGAHRRDADPLGREPLERGGRARRAGGLVERGRRRW